MQGQNPSRRWEFFGGPFDGVVIDRLPEGCVDREGFAFAWHIVNTHGVLSQQQYVYERRSGCKDGWHLARVERSEVRRAA